MTSSILTIGELAAASGLSAHTLRYYEKLGVLRPADRTAGGRRRYRADAVAWLDFVLRLKLTGMPLAEIRTYAQLRAAGRSTLRSRQSLLKQHRERLVSHIAELSANLLALDSKLGTYRKWLRTPGVSGKGSRS